MQALVSHSYGPVDDLVVTEMPQPTPGPGQLLIRVEAAALNPVDVRLVTGAMREMMPIEHPFVPGMDASGVVEAVGDGVSRLSPGDPVVAFTYGGTGSLAEYALANDGPGVVVRPSTVDPVRAAALPVAGLTAAGLVAAAGDLAGASMLIVGATGGVGCFLTQMARQAGATVIATAPPGDSAYVRGLGADSVIDYTTTDTTEEALRLVPGGVDIVVDLVNIGPDLAASAAAAREGGKVLSPLGGPPAFDRGVTAEFCHVEATEGRLQSVVDRVAAGELMVEVSTVRPAGDAPKAVADFAAKHTRGKVVVTF
jgi:NADPH2:quinone reductase